MRHGADCCGVRRPLEKISQVGSIVASIVASFVASFVCVSPDVFVSVVSALMETCNAPLFVFLVVLSGCFKTATQPNDSAAIEPRCAAPSARCAWRSGRRARFSQQTRPSLFARLSV